MDKRWEKDGLGVEMPRYLASYAARERILKKVLDKRRASPPKWTKPAFSLAAAVALIMLLVLPQLAPGLNIFSPGSYNVRLAQDWEQVASNYPNLQDIRVTALEADLKNSALSYRLRVVARDGPEQVEFSLQRSGRELAVDRRVIGKAGPGANVQVLSLLDQSRLLGRLAPKVDLAASLTLQLTHLPQPGYYYGEAWSVIGSNGTVQPLAQGYLEVAGEYFVLTVNQKETEHGYILPIDGKGWKVYDLTYLYSYLLQFRPYSLASITRQGLGWRVEAQLSQTRAVFTFADSSFSNPIHYHGREFGSKDVRNLLEGIGVEVVDLDAREREWVVLARYRNREGIIRFSDADGSILYRSLPLALTAPGTGYYITDTWVMNLNNAPLDFNPQGLLTGIVPVGQGALVEVLKDGGYQLFLMSNATVRQYAVGEDARLGRIAVAPDHNQGLWNDGSWKSGGQLNLPDEPLAIAWSPDSSHVAVATDSGVYLAKNGAATATLVSALPGSGLVWISNFHLAWVEGLQVKIFCLDSGLFETFQVEGEHLYRLSVSGDQLVVAVAGQGKGSVYKFNSSSFISLMPQVDITNAEAFLDSVVCSDEFLIYRSGEDYSLLTVWSNFHAQRVELNLGLATPLFLEEGRLALVGADGAQIIEMIRLFE